MLSKQQRAKQTPGLAGGVEENCWYFWDLGPHQVLEAFLAPCIQALIPTEELLMLATTHLGLTKQPQVHVCANKDNAYAILTRNITYCNS